MSGIADFLFLEELSRDFQTVASVIAGTLVHRGPDDERGRADDTAGIILTFSHSNKLLEFNFPPNPGLLGAFGNGDAAEQIAAIHEECRTT